MFNCNYNISILIHSSYCNWRTGSKAGPALEIQVQFTIIFTNDLTMYLKKIALNAIILYCYHDRIKCAKYQYCFLLFS